MKMKKVLLMVAFVIPVMLMAQTKTAQQKPTQDRVEKIRFEYMEMIATESADKVVESPKKSKKSKGNVSTEKATKSYKMTFNFGRQSKDQQKRAGKASAMRTPLEALSLLGSMGWELTAVSGDSYYLKRRVR